MAIAAINRQQFKSERRATTTFDVPRSTLRDRRAGATPRRDSEPNSKKLTKLEESVVVQHILDLDSRGFPPNLYAVQEMANKLLAERAAGHVGINWPGNFVKRTPELKTQFNRKYDRQRALCEDPQIIGDWFRLVRNTKAKHGILDEDIHNFDEAGFQMGVISTGVVVTGSERRNRPKLVQPGDREWTTIIQGVNACGWAIPPFIIFSGKYHLSAWYEGNDIPPGWVIAVSDNGWTTNELGIAWLHHFNKHTKDRTVGTHRLLIIDGHESHRSLEFEEICKENNIITLCMPAHSSHLLQPLDVGCFAPLKKAYGRQIEELMRNYINHVTKLEFLPAFKAAFYNSITKSNICAGFRGAGLVPLDPEAVLSKLDVRLRTPSPPAIVEEAPWESKTPSNALELGSQSALIHDRIQRHQSSSPTLILDALGSLSKGAATMMHQATLLRDTVASLQKANEAATKRKARKKKRIQREGTLTMEAGSQLAAQRLEKDAQSKRQQGGADSAGSARRCGRCNEPGHNIRTCKNNAEAAAD